MSKAFVSKATVFVTSGSAVILAVIPFHAFLTVWAASVFGHYTLVRLWKEVILVLLLFAAFYLVSQRIELWREMRRSRLFKLLAAYVIVQVLLGLAGYARHDVNRVALGEGLIQDLRLVGMFFVAWVAASYSPWLRQHWQKLLLVPAAIVIAFGLLQITVLPTNFLTHFGYGAQTIKPYELVDQNSGFVRIQSTLRGPNPFGAYLVVVISALAALLISKKLRKNIPDGSMWWFLLISLASLIVLYYSYSRSAILGLILSVAVIAWFSIRNENVKRWLLIAAAAAIVLFGGLVLIFRHNTYFEDTVFHSSQLSHSKTSSNQDRTSALEGGIHDVIHQPLGRGAGSAGPASVHNNHPPRIAENYFLQIGQEAGWLGLAIFIAIYYYVAKGLWERRNDPDGLPLILFASLFGLTLVNMLSHAWADDTLAYLWWGLAGIALALNADLKKTPQH